MKMYTRLSRLRLGTREFNSIQTELLVDYRKNQEGVEILYITSGMGGTIILHPPPTPFPTPKWKKKNFFDCVNSCINIF